MAGGTDPKARDQGVVERLGLVRYARPEDRAAVLDAARRAHAGDDAPAAADGGRGQPCHVWVEGAPGLPGRWPGLLVEWRQVDDGWQARVAVVATGTDGRARVVSLWLPARCVTRA